MEEVKGTAMKNAEGDEEHIAGNWGKGNSYDTPAESLAELRFVVMGEAELIKVEIEYLIEQICIQCVENMNYFLLVFTIKFGMSEMNCRKIFKQKENGPVIWTFSSYIDYKRW